MFVIIEKCHRRIGHHKIQRRGWWAIPLQTIEAIFGHKTVGFFAPNIPSARLLQYFLTLFGAFFMWTYNCNVRANLTTKNLPQPVNRYQVRPFFWKRNVTFQLISYQNFRNWRKEKSSFTLHLVQLNTMLSLRGKMIILSARSMTTWLLIEMKTSWASEFEQG